MNPRLPLLLIMTMLLASCQSVVEYTHDEAPRMVVLHDGVQFYLHGPAQGNGADRTLAKGDEVRTLRKEYGFSFVELGDGQKGYVANEELAVAPPLPSPTPHPSPETVTNCWPMEKSFPDLPPQPTESNEPIAPPVFRY